MKETRELEFKEDVSNTFLKTVSAFANYGGGAILFGVDDEGRIAGLDDPRGACLAIENKINDSITPQPDYTLAIRDADSVVELKVLPGRSKPYLYKSKAYKRNNEATIEADPVELTRLILEGSNTSYEQLRAVDQNLTFDCLAHAMKEHLGLESFGKDTLKTLDLYSREVGMGNAGKGNAGQGDADPGGFAFNNAAALLADANDFPGIDIARFGESLSIIRLRKTFEQESVLAQLESAMGVFDDIYRYEEVSGFVRKDVERIPAEAFREALANAIVHRAWDIRAHIRVAMFDDRVEIMSPGGLPTGITEEEYLREMVSVMRNPILGNVFYRLGIIEAFGTGVRKIKTAYMGSATKPRFDFSDNFIQVTLPVLSADLGLGADEQLVYDILNPVRFMAASEIQPKSGFSRTKLNRILKSLCEGGLVVASGNGRSTKYRRA